jgi:hypothetical protein
MKKRTRSYLFFIFILLFIAITAYTITYASGYKLNISNFKLQKTGVLNIETNPAGAIILIDDKPVESLFKKIFHNQQSAVKTPMRLKNLLPGDYNITLQLEGYWDWQKKLKIEPGLTTNIKELVLFKKDLPGLIYQDDIRVFASTNKKKALITASNGNRVYDLANSQDKLPAVLEDLNISSALWSFDNNKILIDKKWIYESPETLTPISQLLPASTTNIRWDLSNSSWLYYLLDGKVFKLDLNNYKSEQFSLPGKVLDFLVRNGDLFAIRRIDKKVTLSTLQISDKKIIRELDLRIDSDYEFSEQNGYYLNIYDKRLNILYLIDPHSANPLLETIREVKGWQWINDEMLLYFNDAEIWTFDLKNNNKKVLIRISDKIQAVVWHPTKNYIFYNTAQGIFVIELDEREKYNITELFRSTQISNVILNPDGNILYFYAEIGNQRGFYKLSI